MFPSPSRPTVKLASTLAVLIALLLGAPGRSTGVEPSPGTQKAHRFQADITTAATHEYLLFLPREAQANPAGRHPLLVFLHGAGERGTNLASVAVHGPPKLVGSHPDFPFIVASPQCAPHQFWEPAVLDAFLDHLLKNHPVDPARVYLTGLSMGGNGTWAWATRSPHRFAAIAPICGWGDPIRVWLASGPRRDALARLPIWAFHGGKDTVVPLADSQAMVTAFGRLGNEARLTIDPEAGHDSWTAAYANPALFDWFLSHRLP